MVIRCEHCSTLYELDEALLSPSGSQVQCTRCQHVFTAFPPRAPGRTLVGMPEQAEPEPPLPSLGGSGVVSGPRVVSRASTHAAAAGGGRGPAAAAPRPEPRPVRTSPPPVYRPAGGAPAPVPRAPLLRRDTVGTFESRLRWHARWRWLGPLLAGLVVVGGIAAWVLLSRPSAPDASLVRGEALALLARDDEASIEQAVSRLDELLRRTPRLRGVAADRALAQVLRAAAIVEEGESLAARRAAQEAEGERLRREQPAGWQDAERAVAAEAQRLDLEVRAREERARGLAGGAFQLLRRLQGDLGDVPDVARGMATYYALAGDAQQARMAVQSARARAPADPWLALAEGWADARDPDPAVRERAVAELRALSGAHPELLRARLLLARTQAGLGHRDEALATLDALLAANAGHEAGRRLRDELSAPPPPPPEPEPAPEAEAPPPAKPPTQPRKRAAHPAAELTPLPSPAAASEDLPPAPDPVPGAVPGAESRASAREEKGPALPEPASSPAPEAAEPPPAPPLPRLPVPEPQMPSNGG